MVVERKGGWWWWEGKRGGRQYEVRLGQRREEEKTNSKDHVRHVVSSIISNSVIPFHHLSTVDAQVSERLDPHPTMPVRYRLNSGNLFTDDDDPKIYFHLQTLCNRKMDSPLSFFFGSADRCAQPNLDRVRPHVIHNARN